MQRISCALENSSANFGLRKKGDLEDRAIGANQLKLEDSNLTGRDFKYNLVHGPGFKYEKPRLRGKMGFLKRILRVHRSDGVRVWHRRLGLMSARPHKYLALSHSCLFNPWSTWEVHILVSFDK